MKLCDTVTNEEEILNISGLFLGIGHVPNGNMFAGQIDLDDDGYVNTIIFVFTRVAGVFACGDVKDNSAVSAGDYRCGSGCMAALEVEKYLEEHGR